MQTFRTIGLVLLGALVGAGVVAMRDTVRAQEAQESSRITVTPIEWSSRVPFRFVRDGKTFKCYLASLNPRDTTITAMVEAAPGACQ
jgi:hypothetical protein